MKQEKPNNLQQELKNAIKNLDSRFTMQNRKLVDLTSEVFCLKSSYKELEDKNAKLKSQITGLGFWLVVLLGIEFFRFILWWAK